VPTVEGRAVADVEIGGRLVSRIETDPSTFAVPSGDTVIIVSGSESSLAGVLEALP
jgi:hypothetical protein